MFLVVAVVVVIFLSVFFWCGLFQCVVASSRLYSVHHKSFCEAGTPRQHTHTSWVLSESQIPVSIVTSKMYLPKI